MWHRDRRLESKQFHRSLDSTEIPEFICYQRIPGEGNHFLFFKCKENKQKIAKVLQKTVCHTWNVTKMGFQLKHGKTLISVTTMSLEAAQTALRKSNTKVSCERAEEEKCHSIRIP